MARWTIEEIKELVEKASKYIVMPKPEERYPLIIIDYWAPTTVHKFWSLKAAAAFLLEHQRFHDLNDA